MELLISFWTRREKGASMLATTERRPVVARLNSGISYTRTIDAGSTISVEVPETEHIAEIGTTLNSPTLWATLYGRREQAGFETLDDFLILDAHRQNGTITFFGANPVALLSFSVTGASTTYSSVAVSTIVQTELERAIYSWAGDLPSPLRGVGYSITSTSATATYYSAFQPRLELIRDVIAIANAAETSTDRWELAWSPSSFRFSFVKNTISDRFNAIGFRNMLSHELREHEVVGNVVYALGVKREGAAVLYSTQRSPTSTSLVALATPKIYYDITDQATLDSIALAEAKRLDTRFPVFNVDIDQDYLHVFPDLGAHRVRAYLPLPIIGENPNFLSTPNDAAAALSYRIVAYSLTVPPQARSAKLSMLVIPESA
jgi:hypothetical protein